MRLSQRAAGGASAAEMTLPNGLRRADEAPKGGKIRRAFPPLSGKTCVGTS